MYTYTDVYLCTYLYYYKECDTYLMRGATYTHTRVYSSWRRPYAPSSVVDIVMLKTSTSFRLFFFSASHKCTRRKKRSFIFFLRPTARAVRILRVLTTSYSYACFIFLFILFFPYPLTPPPPINVRKPEIWQTSAKKPLPYNILFVYVYALFLLLCVYCSPRRSCPPARPGCGRVIEKGI